MSAGPNRTAPVRCSALHAAAPGTPPARDRRGSDGLRARLSSPDGPEPNTVARRLIGRDYLSPSSIATYQKCPLRFYFQYVAALQPEFTSASLVLGGSVHGAIELHFLRRFEGAPPPAIDELIDAFDRSWRAEATRPIQYGRGESPDSLRDLARRMLEAFAACEVSKLDGLLAVEEELRAPLIEGCPDILGRPDVIAQPDGSLRLVDFKTSRTRWSDAHVQETAQQMHLYAELARPMAESLGKREIRLEVVVLTKTKRPAVETHAVGAGAGAIARTKAMVRRVWAAIRAGHFYPAPSAMKCPSCPYAKACQAWEG